MIVAIDTNCIFPGQVGGIENYTLGLIETLKLPGSPASKLVLLTRKENHELFAPFADLRTAVVKLPRPRHKGKRVKNWASLLAKHPVGGRRTLEEYQHAKTDLLHAHGVDLVHFPGNTINPLDLNLPVVLNLHDLQHRHFPQYFTRAERDNREKWWVASAHRANALLAASGYVATDLRRELGVAPGKIFVAPDAFQASAFSSYVAPVQLQELRNRMVLPERFFIYPAATWAHKNHERLIRAFLAANLSGAELILTGGGQEQLAPLVQKLNAEVHVRLAGRVSTTDLVGLYHLATGMIFPSEYESWSIPIMEAFAAGCPVASANVTSLPEELGDAGLLFHPHDEPAMTHAMQRLASEPELREELAERGRRRVYAFAPAQSLRTLTAAYEHARAAFRTTRKAA